MVYPDLFQIPPYSLNSIDKISILTDHMKRLTKYHIDNCPEYNRMMKGIDFHVEDVVSYYDIPFLPVNLFKELDLLSINHSDIFKTMTSSGTTGQVVSKIYLDRKTANNQQRTLVKIVSDFTGSARMPMLIIDSPSVVKDRTMFSARGAGILGFSIFGTDKTYALNDDMRINFNAIDSFLERHKDKKFLIFGFTYMIWEFFYKELLKLGRKLDLSNGMIIHGGGWKKLFFEAISTKKFKLNLLEMFGLKDVHDYYGMVEQTGCIYMECEYGHLHASIFSDVITRRYNDFSPCEIGEDGIVQVVSMLPESYPGHSLLTEDEGIILGEDDCPCGRKGKYFKIYGRLKNAEIRGCSDTYDAS